jgi:hypothetical protein
MNASEKILDHLNKNGPATMRKIAMETGFKLSTTKNTVYALKGMHKIVATGPLGKRLYGRPPQKISPPTNSATVSLHPIKLHLDLNSIRQALKERLNYIQIEERQIVDALKALES